MNEAWSWIARNYQWVFDGFGVALVVMLAGLIWQKKRRGAQTIQAGRNSINLQARGDISIQGGDLNARSDHKGG